MDFKSALDTLIAEVKRMIEKAIEAAPFDKTYRGRVVAIESGKCSVQVNGTIYTIKTSATYAVGDYINVLVPRNNWNNAVLLDIEKAIDGALSNIKVADSASY